MRAVCAGTSVCTGATLKHTHRGNTYTCVTSVCVCVLSVFVYYLCVCYLCLLPLCVCVYKLGVCVCVGITCLCGASGLRSCASRQSLPHSKSQRRELIQE